MQRTAGESVTMANVERGDVVLSVDGDDIIVRLKNAGTAVGKVSHAGKTRIVNTTSGFTPISIKSRVVKVSLNATIEL
jgi:hypothetical protein